MCIIIFLVACFLSVCSLATTKQPTEQVKDFYSYYLSTFATASSGYQDPELRRYVSADTLDRLHKVMTIPEQEIVTSDYFTYTQDYDTAWITALKVGDVHDEQQGKSVDIYLGIEDGKYQHLKAYLIQESGIWKISRVRDISHNYEQKIFDKQQSVNNSH